MESVARKPTLHIKVGSVKEQSPKFYFDDSQENQKIDNNPEAKKPDLAFSGIRFLLTWYTGSAENRNNRSHHEDKHCQRPNRKDHITRNRTKEGERMSEGLQCPWAHDWVFWSS
jgi:hypothetical protein